MNSPFKQLHKINKNNLTKTHSVMKNFVKCNTEHGTKVTVSNRTHVQLQQPAYNVDTLGSCHLTSFRSQEFCRFN